MEKLNIMAKHYAKHFKNKNSESYKMEKKDLSPYKLTYNSQQWDTYQ